jgi:poly(hydroxyalkanoate) granule-associated protein
MAEKTKPPAVEAPQPVNQPSEEHGGIVNSLRRVLLASIGVAVVTRDELKEFIDKMVERGEIAEEEGKKLYKELMEKRKKKTDEAQEVASNQMRDMLDRMDVPTKSDIDVLGEKISALSKKVDELKKAQG